MRVLDLFAGLGGLSRGFKDRGHEVITLDYEAKFGCDLTMDVCEFAKDPQRHLNEAAVAKGWIQAGDDWVPDVVLGGPPCEALTVLTIGRHWHPAPTHAPKTDKARLAVQLVQAFLEVIAWCNEKRASLGLPPLWWWMENPRAKLRALPIMKGHRRVTVPYCAYGKSYQKPTDIWGVWPASWKAKPMCDPGAACHISAPRGSKQAGTIQGIGGKDRAAKRAEVPVALSLSLYASPARTRPRTPPPSTPSETTRSASQQGLKGSLSDSDYPGPGFKPRDPEHRGALARPGQETTQRMNPATRIAAAIERAKHGQVREGSEDFAVLTRLNQWLANEGQHAMYEHEWAAITLDRFTGEARHVESEYPLDHDADQPTGDF